MEFTPSTFHWLIFYVLFLGSGNCLNVDIGAMKPGISVTCFPTFQTSVGWLSHIVPLVGSKYVEVFRFKHTIRLLHFGCIWVIYGS